jgi:hypothetical protein
LAASNIAVILQGHAVWGKEDISPFFEGTPANAAPNIVNADQLKLKVYRG